MTVRRTKQLRLVVLISRATVCRTTRKYHACHNQSHRELYVCACICVFGRHAQAATTRVNHHQSDAHALRVELAHARMGSALRLMHSGRNGRSLHRAWLKVGSSGDAVHKDRLASPQRVTVTRADAWRS